MAVSSELAGMLTAITEPAMLIRASDMTVAAVNEAFGRVFGAFRFEGKLCWEALHHANACDQCGLGCPISQAERSKAAVQIEQTLYSGARTRHYQVTVHPIMASDGYVRYWLETIVVRRGLGPSYMSRGMVGISASYKRTEAMIDRAAKTSIPVVVVGEKGVGKELYARTIHENSARATLPFVTIRGAQLTLDVLFGKNEASGRLIDRVRDGSLFIEEIGDVSLTMQQLLLQMLERDCYQDIDGSQHELLMRLMCSSSYELHRLIDEGKLLPALGQYLQSYQLHVDPLRMRREDIPVIVQHLLKGLVPGIRYTITDEAMALMKAADWFGNEKEIFRVLEGAAIRASDHRITVQDLPTLKPARGVEIFMADAPIVPLDELKARYLCWVDQAFSGSRSDLARLLDVSERTLYRLVKEARVKTDHGLLSLLKKERGQEKRSIKR